MVADECRIQRESGVTSIWFKKGKYPNIKVDQKREAVSFYGALNIKTGEETVLDASRQTSRNTVSFLRKLERIYQRKDVLLIWDGAPWHRGEVKKYLKEKNKKWKLQLMYFPPYSPDYNPQEQVWKRSKQEIIHNSEEEFEVKILNFYKFLVRTKFNTNFINK
ncbi:IS630 family transposase [Candidatus Gottesmanbacteria bacterium]|nr:IS630 family transposase [Candidatus Gottesmanbacteria bacterium]